MANMANRVSNCMLKRCREIESDTRSVSVRTLNMGRLGSIAAIARAAAARISSGRALVRNANVMELALVCCAGIYTWMRDGSVTP